MWYQIFIRLHLTYWKDLGLYHITKYHFNRSQSPLVTKQIKIDLDERANLQRVQYKHISRWLQGNSCRSSATSLIVQTGHAGEMNNAAHIPTKTNIRQLLYRKRKRYRQTGPSGGNTWGTEIVHVYTPGRYSIHGGHVHDKTNIWGLTNSRHYNKVHTLWILKTISK